MKISSLKHIHFFVATICYAHTNTVKISDIPQKKSQGIGYEVKESVERFFHISMSDSDTCSKSEN